MASNSFANDLIGRTLTPKTSASAFVPVTQSEALKDDRRSKGTPSCLHRHMFSTLGRLNHQIHNSYFVRIEKKKKSDQWQGKQVQGSLVSFRQENSALYY